MNVLWRSDSPLSVRAVHDSLRDVRGGAYTTVMTVLDRLAKKGIVERQLEGRAWRYQPARSRVDLYVAAVQEILNELGAEDRRAVEAALR